MAHWTQEITRRRFLSGLAVLGSVPYWRTADALAWLQPAREFTGDNFELAHKLLMNPDEILRGGTPQVHPDPLDVIVVGGGISGLTIAYKLRDKRVLVLESAAQPGGVSKSERWQGIDYALGAAYIIDPDPDSDDPQEKAGFQLLEELDLRKRGEDLARDRSRQRRLSGEASHTIFSNRRVVPDAEVYSARNTAFFEHVLASDRYPSIPATDKTLVDALDNASFRQFLATPALQRQIYGRTVGAISPLGWEAIEYYCWGAFGTAARETSAYHGLNFFAAEYGDILVFPGGNGFITRRLAERIERAAPGRIRTGTWVLRIAKDTGGFTVTAWQNDTLHQFRSRAVVFAAPLFLAPKIVPALPEAQRRAIGRLAYRSYLVANVLLRRPADQIFAHRSFRDGYELTRVHGVNVAAEPAEAISKRKVYSDAILADFASGRNPTHAVLTVYRPYPFDAGRPTIFSATYDDLESEIRREVLAGFGPHGLRGADIEGMRLTRWGHPMIVTRPGQLADGTLAAAAQPWDGLWLSHTDVMGAPAYENALAAAFRTVRDVTAYLAS